MSSPEEQAFADHRGIWCKGCNASVPPGGVHMHYCPEAGTNPKDLLGLKKPPLRLIPAAAMLYESRVMALGASKYGPFNWRAKKVKLTVYLEAAMRHILAKIDGQDLDPESGMPHEAHARACMGILLDAHVTGNLVDDRPTPGAAARLIAELTEK